MLSQPEDNQMNELKEPLEVNDYVDNYFDNEILEEMLNEEEKHKEVIGIPIEGGGFSYFEPTIFKEWYKPPRHKNNHKKKKKEEIEFNITQIKFICKML
ncbi:hypothetical protein QTN25_009815 [Entamoeba marina]